MQLKLQMQTNPHIWISITQLTDSNCLFSCNLKLSHSRLICNKYNSSINCSCLSRYTNEKEKRKFSLFHHNQSLDPISSSPSFLVPHPELASHRNSPNLLPDISSNISHPCLIEPPFHLSHPYLAKAS